MTVAILQLNNKKMAELGVNENENPIIYFIPFVNQLIASYSTINGGNETDAQDSGFSYDASNLDENVQATIENAPSY